jgi:hypothetical protein
MSIRDLLCVFGHGNLEIVFKCPECSGQAKVEMDESEAETIKQRILNEGRSPTLIVRCEGDHELLVTLYNLRTGEGLGLEMWL